MLRQRQCSPAGTEGRRTGFGTKMQIRKVRMLSGQHKFARAGTSERQRPGFEIKMEIHKAKTPSGKKKLIRAWLPYGPPRPPPPGTFGPPSCPVFTARGDRIGIPHANWTTWVSEVPRFCVPARQNRRAARELGNLGLEYAAFLRSGRAKTACRTRTGRSGPPADRQNTTESAHATAIPRYDQRFRRPGRRIPVSVANSENGISEYTGNHRPGRGSGRHIPVSVANSQNCIPGYAVNYRPGRHQ